METCVRSAIGRLRLLGFVEGLSFLVLLLVAMPLKYGWDMPGPVRVFGAIHGGLFVIYVLQAIMLAYDQRWSFRRETLPVLLGSIVPLGTWWADAKILKPRQEKGAA